MKIEFDLAQVADYAAGLPTWAWVAAAVHGWYLVAGLVIRRMGHGAGSIFQDKATQVFAWFVSPVMAVSVAALYALWASVWMSSAFLFPRPRWPTPWTEESLTKARAKDNAIAYSDGGSFDPF